MFTFEISKSVRGGFYAYMEYMVGDGQIFCFASKRYERAEDARKNGYAECIKQCQSIIGAMNKDSLDDGEWLLKHDGCED